MPSPLFVALIRTTDLEPTEELRQPHRDYLDGLVADGSLVVSGPLATGEVAGIFVLTAPDLAAARQLVADEPFHQAGVYRSEVTAWRPVKGSLLATITAP
jgi:uncharacterized protein YciI